MEHFEMTILNKNHIKSSLIFFLQRTQKEKGMTSEISPAKDLIDIKGVTTTGSVFWKCTHLFTNRTSLELQSLLSLFSFFKIWSSKLGSSLFQGCGFYSGFQGSSRQMTLISWHRKWVLSTTRALTFVLCFRQSMSVKRDLGTAKPVEEAAQVVVVFTQGI